MDAAVNAFLDQNEIPRQVSEQVPLPVAFGGVGRDASARGRVSQVTTLFDGKTLNADETNLWDSKGTGTGAWANQIYGMSVTSGQYLVRQAKYFNPYFSGKSQVVEITFDTFALDTNVVKRAGYFSSSAVAPYTADQDGFWLESDGVNGTYKLVVSKAGTKTLDIDWTAWDNYDELKTYDWDGFTVVLFDFLWLGGAILRMFVKTSRGFVLAHTFNFAGSGVPGIFIKSPQQPVRYEIRSTTGAGAFNAICSQVASEGSSSEVGKNQALYSAAITTNVASTIYAVAGIRAATAYRDQVAHVLSYGGVINEVGTDAGIFMLLLNPTLSAPLTWAADGRIERGTATNQTITAGTGVLLDAFALTGAGASQVLAPNILARTAVGIDNAMGQIILAYMPVTANQAVNGVMTLQYN